MGRWWEKAACAGTPLSFWFRAGEYEYRRRPKGDTAAKLLCRQCPVLGECGVDVVRFEGLTARGKRYGVVGGLLPGERYEHRRVLRGLSASEFADWVRAKTPAPPG